MTKITIRLNQDEEEFIASLITRTKCTRHAAIKRSLSVGMSTLDFLGDVKEKFLQRLEDDTTKLKKVHELG